MSEEIKPTQEKKELARERDQEINELVNNMNATPLNDNPWGPRELFKAFRERGITREETELWNNQSGRNSWVVSQYEKPDSLPINSEESANGQNREKIMSDSEKLDIFLDAMATYFKEQAQSLASQLMSSQSYLTDNDRRMYMHNSLSQVISKCKLPPEIEKELYRRCE